MPYVGVVLHHSACPTINGKGFDFYITAAGTIVPGSEETSQRYIHICVEGDFNHGRASFSKERLEQLFVLQKLLLKLSELHGFALGEWHAHNDACPGRRFPWGELVISQQDGYH